MDAIVVSPTEGTSRAVRSKDTWQPAHLIGADGPIRFLCRHLLTTGNTPDTRLLPNKQTLLLYGRPGCGKNTLIHAIDQETGKRVFLDQPAFSEVRDWKMRPWNGTEFGEWARACCRRIQLIENDDSAHRTRAELNVDRTKNPPTGALLILIQDIHHLLYYRGNGDPATALLQLLTTARRCSVRHDRVRILMTCSESPGQFPQDIQDLIGARCYVPLFEARDRIAFMLQMMREFRALCAKDPTLANVAWVDIDLNDDAFITDPDHILNTLAIYSVGTTPRELHDFMLRSFDACRYAEQYQVVWSVFKKTLSGSPLMMDAPSTVLRSLTSSSTTWRERSASRRTTRPARTRLCCSTRAWTPRSRPRTRAFAFSTRLDLRTCLTRLFLEEEERSDRQNDTLLKASPRTCTRPLPIASRSRKSSSQTPPSATRP